MALLRFIGLLTVSHGDSQNQLGIDLPFVVLVFAYNISLFLSA